MCLADKATTYWGYKPNECPIRKHRFAGEIHRYCEYYQQSLSSLAKSAEENEVANIRNSCQKFIEGNTTYWTAFNSLSDQHKS